MDITSKRYDNHVTPDTTDILSQVTKNIEDNTYYGTGYHGYWQEDIYSVNPHFGTAADLLALSNALHARNSMHFP
jgi:glycosidase